MKSKYNNNTKIEEADWKYLPNIYQLSLYLARNDIIQLSSTCKYLRLKLKSNFISKLELMRGGMIIPSKPNKSSKKRQLNILFDVLEQDYLNGYNIVNHCIIWEFFNSRFAKNFFNLFTNITRLELYSGYNKNDSDYLSMDKKVGSNTVLIEVLYPLKSLESLIVGSELINNLKYSSRLALNLPSCLKIFRHSSRLILKLPLCLKNLTLIESELNQNQLKFYPIEFINEEYSNLNKVAIISNRMLSNMSVSMKSLVDVDIFSYQKFTKRNIAKFLLLNPQLEKLTIPVYFLEHNLVNSILQMKQLKQLSINYSPFKYYDDISYTTVNTSIEYLNISSNIGSDRVVPFLNNLKSLKVLEFSNVSFYIPIYINFSECTNRIPLLHLKNLGRSKEAIDSFNNSEIFDSIRFTDMFELEYYLENYEGDDLDNWGVCQLDLENNEDFSLIKIS
jgi:hypothetical protein